MFSRAIEDEFLALLCGDEEVVRAEFDAIIEANWEEPPPVPAPRAPAPRMPHPTVVRPLPLGPPNAVVGSRQRSPPQ